MKLKDWRKRAQAGDILAVLTAASVVFGEHELERTSPDVESTERVTTDITAHGAIIKGHGKSPLAFARGILNQEKQGAG